MFNNYKKIFLILIALMAVSAPLSARVLELSSSNQHVSFKQAEVYKPSKLMIGTKTGFIIKAEPHSFVALSIAADEDGEELIANIRGVVGEKGITEIEVELPDDKELVNRVVYFEVAVWKNEDLSDATRARIVGTDGRNTGTNALVITGKPSANLLPGLGPAMPGVGDVSQTMEALHEDNEYSSDEYFYNKPLILRNLRTPDAEEQDYDDDN